MTKQEQETNFLPREKVGRYPKEGDVFYYKHKHLGYGYGVVVTLSEGSKEGKFWAGALVYLYDNFSKELENDPKLNKNKLVLPPTCAFFYEFSSGPFVKIKNIKLKKEDFLDVNCFYDLLRKKYFDFFSGKEIERVEPCGNSGTKSILYIDALISEAKGVPIAVNNLTEDRIKNGSKFKNW